MSINQYAQDRINQYNQKQVVSTLINNLVSKESSDPLPQQKSIESNYTSSQKAEGLLYRGFITIGAAAGALTGYVTSGGQHKFVSGGWIDTLFGMIAGLMIGVGLGQISDAILNLKRR